ncbi:iron-containing redox enzyme family protein [Chamaesiphon sp. OTE_75_metabat_556]|uniref:iron-containing redox enzyme family protein n=1 Tax=Chamaesiphon sp. OTE_75_metabat_556 TaxID=2964692 RepID=UPI00286BC7C0|nr:iron-containing redox enzyme family protein [Chamaesiphon sp. OTE_75_metabat_556]
MSNSEHASTASVSINANENTSDSLKLSLENQHSIERQSQVGFDPERLISTKTYVEVGIEKLTALCESLGMNAKLAEVVEIFRAMTISWSDRQIGESTQWPSDVSDDGSPFEFSIALDPDKVELRVLVEAQGQDPNLQSNWQAGLELNQYLATHYNVSLDRFAQIADLFVPTNTDAKFSMWHSACFYPDKPSAFKLYLNPQSQHKSRSAAIVEESFVRLGFTHAWPTLAETAAQRGPDKDEFVYFSLDLAAHQHARVKVYLRHHDATPAELESALSAARNYVPGDAIEFCQAMAPGQTSFSAKPAISAFSWVESDNATPSSSTLHIPISNYATDDRAVCDRLDLYLIEHGLPVSTYQAAIRSLSTRPLETGIGMHSYTALRREQQQRRVTLYLNPEINGVRHPSTTLTQLAKSIPSLEDMLWYYENHPLDHHPVLQRLQREPVNPQHLWLLFMNLRLVVTNFSRSLASIIARNDDERIRCLLAKQLNEELGNGNINRIHRKLFEQLMTGIEPWRMVSFTEDMLKIGKEYDECLQDLYLDPNPFVGLGAAMLLEVYGKQFDLCMGREFRKTNIARSAIVWLTLHEELEVGHADESLVIARFATESKDGVTAAKQGFEKTRLASWRFLDGLYQLCYGASSVTV